MGFLPIFLALAGFIFLWAVLVYNGIKSTQKKLNLTAMSIQKLNDRRLELIKGLENKEPSFSGFLSHLRQGIHEESLEEPISTWETQERHIQEQQINMFEKEGYTAETEALITELAETSKKIRSEVGSYYAGIRSYNRLILKAPHRYLAGPMGFQPI